MAAQNKYVNESPGHRNFGFRDSISVDPRASQTITADGNSENKGTFNRAFSEEKKENLEDSVDENTNKNLKHDENGIEMSKINGIKEKGLINGQNNPWRYINGTNNTPATVRNGGRA